MTHLKKSSNGHLIKGDSGRLIRDCGCCQLVDSCNDLKPHPTYGDYCSWYNMVTLTCSGGSVSLPICMGGTYTWYKPSSADSCQEPCGCGGTFSHWGSCSVTSNVGCALNIQCFLRCFTSTYPPFIRVYFDFGDIPLSAGAEKCYEEGDRCASREWERYISVRGGYTYHTTYFDFPISQYGSPLICDSSNFTGSYWPDAHKGYHKDVGCWNVTDCHAYTYWNCVAGYEACDYDEDDIPDSFISFTLYDFDLALWEST